jgi:RNA polymerase sigma factor (sigma-70 family)
LKDLPVRWDDESLVKGCLCGKAEAQKALYDKYSQVMMGLCFRYARNRSDAEDVLQEGFIKVFFSLSQYRANGSLEGWIKKIMITTSINFLRKQRNFFESIESDRATDVAGTLSSENHLYEKDVMEAIGKLPPGYRTILNLYAIEGYSHKEIGEMMDITESTSRSQYARAKNFLSRVLYGVPRILVDK